MAPVTVVHHIAASNTDVVVDASWNPFSMVAGDSIKLSGAGVGTYQVYMYSVNPANGDQTDILADNFASGVTEYAPVLDAAGAAALAAAQGVYNVTLSINVYDTAEPATYSSFIGANIDPNTAGPAVLFTAGYTPAPAPAPAPSGGVTSAQHTPVTVNFNVSIEGDSNITVFGEAVPQVTNVIDAEVDLPVNALYDGRDAAAMKGLIELWEPSSAPDDIYAQLANTDSSANGGENLTGAYKVTLRQFAKGLQRLLCGAFDCSAAAPFSESKYSGSLEYTTQRDFGRVALGCFAHFMFGHVDATSAISNDTQFVKSMLSITSNAAAISEEPTGPADRYAAYDAAILTEIAGEFSAWTNTAGSALDANLARRLVAAVVNKGLDAQGNPVVSHVSDGSADSIANIVKQVVGQDATRLMDEDNAERTKNVHRLLRFYPGDVIYMNIILNKPTVTVGTGQTVAGQNIADNYSSVQNYTLKITLKAEEDL